MIVTLDSLWRALKSLTICLLYYPQFLNKDHIDIFPSKSDHTAMFHSKSPVPHWHDCVVFQNVPSNQTQALARAHAHLLIIDPLQWLSWLIQAEQAGRARFSEQVHGLELWHNFSHHILVMWLAVYADKRYLGLASELLYFYSNNLRSGGGVMAHVIIVLAPALGWDSGIVFCEGLGNGRHF